jgi:hypothetical protein
MSTALLQDEAFKYLLGELDSEQEPDREFRGRHINRPDEANKKAGTSTAALDITLLTVGLSC